MFKELSELHQAEVQGGNQERVGSKPPPPPPPPTPASPAPPATRKNIPFSYAPASAPPAAGPAAAAPRAGAKPAAASAARGGPTAVQDLESRLRSNGAAAHSHNSRLAESLRRARVASRQAGRARHTEL